MSNGKRFALPTQKGTELFPKVMQSPAKLVIKDVPPHSPLYNAVASKFSGQLKSFHAKAQQAYALSNNPIGRARYNWGPARATYTNIQGQELLELEVAVPVLSQIEKELEQQPEVSVTKPPNWAVIEIRVPAVNGSRGFWLAKLGVTNPLGSLGQVDLPQLNMTAEIDAASVFSNNIDWFDFAHSSGEIDVDAPHEIIASLLVDLRPYHGFSAIAVELYGYMESYGVSVLVPNGGTSIVAQTLATSVWSGAAYPAGTASLTIGATIDLYPELAGLRWVIDFSAPATLYTVYYYDAATRSLISTGDTTILDSAPGPNEFHIIKNYTVPTYDEVNQYPDSSGLRAAPVWISLLDDGELDWEWQTYEMITDTPLLPAPTTSYNRWIIGDGSRQLQFNQAGNVNVLFRPDTETPPYSIDHPPVMPFLGAMTIDLEHRAWGLELRA